MTGSPLAKRRPARLCMAASTCASLVLSAGVAVLSTTPAAAATPAVLAFDFGGPGTPVAAGYSQVANTTLYTAERGYGIVGTPAFRDRAAPDEVRRDFTNGSSYGFQVDVPNGEYHVSLLSGDQIASNRTGVSIEGIDKGQVTSAAAQFGELTSLVTITDGQLNVALRNDGRVNALVITPIATPQALRVSGLTVLPESSVSLAWDAVDRATSYRVYRAPAGSADFTRVGGVSGLAFTDETVRLGDSYTYAVTSVFASGAESGRSATADVTVVDPEVTAPAAPIELHLITATTTARTLAWQPADGAVRYRVERADVAVGAAYEVIGEVEGTRFVDETLPASTASYRVVALNAGGLSPASAPVTGPATAVVLRQAERLDRGAVAVTTGEGVLVSWRLLGTEPQEAGFHVYRDGQRLTVQPITTSTNYLDRGAPAGAAYQVSAVIRGVEQQRSQPVEAWASTSLDIPLDRPAGGTSPDGTDYTYRANDASTGDLDGDGQLEIVLKWDPTNSKDNSVRGYTGETILDAYELDGTRLWRIGMGRNIRSGAHYTQFLVYDFDGDGKAEVVAKTADGTTDGTGAVIGDPAGDHRNSEGYVLSGPEYLTVFSGQTGQAVATTEYLPARGSVAAWGDSYGNRVDRFLAGVAYLDGERPSIVMGRGYYTRSVVATWDFRDGQLTERWVFDSNDPGNGAYAGQGNHSLSVADIDGDSKDEIVYGSMAVDDDGTGLYTTGLGHGDAMHLSDLDPSRPGLEVFTVKEESDAELGLDFRDADSGESIWGRRTGKDTGRGLAADVDPRHAGTEAWAVDAGFNSTTGWLYRADGDLLGTAIPPANFGIWWDGDLGRELLDHTWSDATQTGVGRIDEWNYTTGTTQNLLTATGTQSDNGTKGNPVLQADLLGDWREEVIWRTDDSTALRLFATPFATEHRLPTLLHDPVYRLGVAWQNVGYNQPPHTSYFLGFDMTSAPTPLLQHARSGADVVAISPEMTPDTWDVTATGGPKEIRVALRPPAGASAQQVTGLRLVVNGRVVEANTLDARGAGQWQAGFNGPTLRAALAGSTGQVAVSVVAYLTDGRTLAGTDTVTLEGA
jgi:fibronectin type 3 domain-containing protein